MKKLLVLMLVVLADLSFAYAGNRENELTGVYRKRSGKQPARLELDGHGRIKQIELSGACLNDIPDGARLWVKGQIKSWIQGVANADGRQQVVAQITQQQPTQWVILMAANRCQRIKKPFESPQEKAKD